MTEHPTRLQHGALPYRVQGGQLEIMLITSRETRRWIIPKGWPMKKRSPAEAAAREAFEEAGVVGRVEDRPIGSYDYEKKLWDGAVVGCHVEVFPLRVSKQRRRWPEFEQRTTAWFRPAEAAELVQEPELSELIRRSEALLAHSRKRARPEAA